MDNEYEDNISVALEHLELAAEQATDQYDHEALLRAHAIAEEILAKAMDDGEEGRAEDTDNEELNEEDKEIE